MLFSSMSFLFYFLPIVLFLYYMSENKYKNIILLVSSLFFYGYGTPKHLLLMLTSILMNYFFGILVDKYRNSKRISLLLFITVISNLSILVYYKYSNFFIDNINRLFDSNIINLKIIMPIGISFFTFQGLSYVIDVYRGHGKVQKSPINVALYVSLFPQLIAGPIVRYETVADQMENRNVDTNIFAIGIERFILGLSKKILIANTFARVADEIFNQNLSSLDFGLAWIGALAYTIQIYFDFSGYSDMAIGLGKMFGFDFLENFNYPYISKSITEFWRRWHISLSTWFRDYVYIPLGGNRVNIIRHVFNTMAVWVLTGFWHGASWNFIVWGMYFGVLIISEKYIYGKYLEKLPSIFRHIYTLILVVIGWVFFRSDNLSYAIEYIKLMFNYNIGISTIRYITEYKIEWVIAIIASIPIYNKLKINNILKYCFLIILFIVSVVYLVASTYNPFIYFRF